ncbi:MAG: ImmA/IrrE family metallo-endopeptidase [Planctomycetes bacterium]|nr:ImmA/IrrE family metallo-endopeptidase [Planctomycetota bacterium]
MPELDRRVIGRRLAEARKARGVTQEEAAGHLECSRPTLIATEKGERPAKPEEIVRLAAFYGRSVHELLRPGEPVSAFEPHLRVAAQRMRLGDHELMEAIGEFQRFVEDYCELERIAGAPLRYNYPAEIKLRAWMNVDDVAEDAAAMERRRLGLGDQPTYELRGLLEWDVGARIFYAPLPSAVAGMFVYLAEQGCCILINVKHPPERRRASIAHEYGHSIVDRYSAAVDPLTYARRKPANERFAEGFAMALLMPTTSVRRRFHEIMSSAGDFRWADLCRLSSFFFVSVEAMTLRLEKLGLIRRGSYDHLKESGFKVRKAEQLLELPRRQESAEPYPERYKFLAVQAFEEGKISEGQLARFLRCDRVSARALVAACLRQSRMDRKGEPQEIQLSLEESLLP